MQSLSPQGQPQVAAIVRVLHCIPTLAVGGAETQLRLLAPQLKAQGVEVAIIGRFADEDALVLTQQGVTCFRLHSTSNYDPEMVAALMRAVRQFRPTVIQTWLTQMDILGGLVARIFGIPWIIAERSSPPAYPPSTKNRLRQWIGRRATVIANAPQGRDVWPRHDVDVIGNGIDFAGIAGLPPAPLADTVAFAGRIAVATVSRLVPEKSIDVLVAAVALARERMPKIRLIVVGDGPDRSRLQMLVEEQGLGDHVVFTGFQADPLAWMRSAAMFASASQFEGHPNAVTEAVAAGVPTILSDIAPHRSLLGQGALYAPVGDASAFAAHMMTLAADAHHRQAIAAQARDAIRGFDINSITARYRVLYERLARYGASVR